MKEKTIISTATMITTLLAYWYAKQADKDSIPYLVAGGFIGSILGETIADNLKKDNNEQKPV